MRRKIKWTVTQFTMEVGAWGAPKVSHTVIADSGELSMYGFPEAEAAMLEMKGGEHALLPTDVARLTHRRRHVASVSPPRQRAAAMRQ